jgi:seryl-tRNA synthetase
MTSSITASLEGIAPEYAEQVRYALAFLSEDVLTTTLDDGTSGVAIAFKPGADLPRMQARIDELLARYRKSDFGARSVVYADNRRDLPMIDAWPELLARRWATPVGEGHVILRGPAARLMEVIDRKVLRVFGGAFNAEREVFPATIRAETLQRCNHFTSFPEHMDFVAHLRSDLDVLSEFSNGCRTDGWSPALHEGRMGPHDLAISPSCCYHAYEGMEGWSLEKPGRALTAILNCHRYEGANHRSLMRLRSFSMREVVWVGQPAWVLACRARAEELMQEWAVAWQISCTFETANDMFFTDDFAVKASFQRQQEAKRELRADIPSEKTTISIFSSNFHAATFGRAFGITAGGRPAVSACVGWGLERWVLTILSQHGFEPSEWPIALREEYDALEGGAIA